MNTKIPILIFNIVSTPIVTWHIKQPKYPHSKSVRLPKVFTNQKLAIADKEAVPMIMTVPVRAVNPAPPDIIVYRMVLE